MRMGLSAATSFEVGSGAGLGLRILSRGVLFEPANPPAAGRCYPHG